MKIGVLLSGAGLYDGSEIQETIFTLLAINENGGEVLYFAPNENQMHVVNHFSGEVMNETRNTLIESARIARGDIEDLVNISCHDFDALVIPGGFGTAKNHTTWSVDGHKGKINVMVKRLILDTIAAKKPIAALCMGATTISKSLENSDLHPILSVGKVNGDSPYDIESISNGMRAIGTRVEMCGVDQISRDVDLKIVCAPCFMIKASVMEVRANVKMAIDVLFSWL